MPPLTGTRTLRPETATAVLILSIRTIRAASPFATAVLPHRLNAPSPTMTLLLVTPQALADVSKVTLLLTSILTLGSLMFLVKTHLSGRIGRQQQKLSLLLWPLLSL